MTDRTLYDAGWDDSIQMLKDRRALQNRRHGFSSLLLLISGMMVGIVVAVILIALGTNQAIYNYIPLLWLGGVGIISGVGGLFLNKKEAARYKQLEIEFYQKWQARWNELGFSGDK